MVSDSADGYVFLPEIVASAAHGAVFECDMERLVSVLAQELADVREAQC